MLRAFSGHIAAPRGPLLDLSQSARTYSTSADARTRRTSSSCMKRFPLRFVISSRFAMMNRCVYLSPLSIIQMFPVASVSVMYRKPAWTSSNASAPVVARRRG